MSVEATTSIQLAIERMREAGQDLIPVVEDGRLIGVLTEAGILRFVAEGFKMTDAVSDYVEPAPIISNRATGAEALRRFEKDSSLVVVDEQNSLCGLVLPSSFVTLQPERQYPNMVGGMATPFGVYLTTGSVRGGKKDWYLVSTGFFMISIVLVGEMLFDKLAKVVPQTAMWGNILAAAPFLLMALVFRIHPIAGYHAAEHQVVHAIEREEELTPDVVSRMPRVHPRCGTNLVVAAGLFYLISNILLGKESFQTNVIGLILTVFLWRSAGAFVQTWITTKKPNRKQIESGIAAGKELLANFEVAPNRRSTPWLRILNSGMLHVMAGSIAASLVWWPVGKLVGFDVF